MEPFFLIVSSPSSFVKSKTAPLEDQGCKEDQDDQESHLACAEKPVIMLYPASVCWSAGWDGGLVGA